MNIFLLITILLSSAFLHANNIFEKTLEKITYPYWQAAELLESAGEACQVESLFISNFFEQTKLYTKKPIKKFKQSLNLVKKLSKRKRLSTDQIIFANRQILKLELIEEFIIKHASTYYADRVYNEIETMYHYLDENAENLVDTLIEKPWLIHLTTMAHRNLYHVVKKIDLDVRRLQALTTRINISDDMLKKINSLTAKALTIKTILTESKLYKKQLRQTRWLKACGIFVPLFILCPVLFSLGSLMSLNVAIIYIPILIFAAIVIGLIYAATIMSIIATVQDIQEAKNYDIPVHARSVFSLVSWQGWLIFIGIRIPFFIFAII